MVGRLDNGYHELDSLICFADTGDTVHAQPADTLSLTVTGPFATGLGNDPDNLVLKAAAALAKQSGEALGASLRLEKNLPVASGIGGGSADAAATLHALNHLWQIGLDEKALSRVGQSIGADVPVCLFGRTAHVRGIGENIEQGPKMPEMGLLMVNPGVAVSTATVFANRHGGFSGPVDLPASFASAEALAGFLKQCRNDLLAPASALSPKIDAVLDHIAGQKDCLHASLSGSGATCFGLFDGFAQAQSAASQIRVQQPKWWVQASRFLNVTPPPQTTA